MTPAQAIDGMYELYAKTVAHLEQDGWDAAPEDGNVDGQIPKPCVLADGSRGVQYSIDLLGPGQAEPLAAAKFIASFWKSVGLTAQAAVPSNPKNPMMIANGISSSVDAQYTVSQEGASLSLVSACVAGDEEALHEKVVQNRERSAGATPPTE